ncbi:MAG: hypothetical protein JOZ57_02145, partial [Abitibacteriaceae bacterium]|nr:hypothetical protein [Abditibacteriaceae bacterium]
AEQRRFRRLEVSLPVWLALEEDFDRPGAMPWSLGYTRDLSMGGSKVFVPSVEEVKWRDAKDRGVACLLRFDAPNIGSEEYITSRVRHVAHDGDSGNVWLGCEYDEGAQEAKAASVRAGLKTVKARRRWQGAFVALLLVLGLSGLFINKLRGDILKKQAEVNHYKKIGKELNRQLGMLSQPRLVGTRAEGIESSFKRKEVQQKIRELSAHISKLSSDKNISAGEMERQRQRQAEGINLPNLGGNVNVNLGVAWPQGYAWPQVTSDFEELLQRRVPTIVIFKDFKTPFPLADAQEARVRAKTLQITWEPWLNYVNPIKLQDIVAGKYDKYIDSWANAAKTFGNEVWIRWGHEFNGNWYPWATVANNKNPKIYAAAFRHVRDRFNRVGAFNVRWVWCINAETVPNVAWNNPLLAYPGDAYVDMISIDGYNFGTALPSSHWESFDEVFAIPYSKVIQKFPNKPVMINEVGCATVGGDKVAWIKAMDNSLRKTFTKIQGVVWFEAQKEADWRMDSSPESLATCARVFNQTYYRRGIT